MALGLCGSRRLRMELWTGQEKNLAGLVMQEEISQQTSM